MCMPKVQVHRWVQQFYPPLTIKGKWTVSTLWQHPGWFSTDKGTFSGSDLVQNTMIWSLFQCKAQSSIVWFYRSGPLFITNRGSLQFLSLDITQTECQSSAEDPAELPYNISLFFVSVYVPGVRQPLGKKATHAIKKLPSFSCLLLFGLQLTNPVLVSASNSLPTLHATSKATIFWSCVAVAFRSSGVSLSSSRKLSHLQREAVWLS